MRRSSGHAGSLDMKSAFLVATTVVDATYDPARSRAIAQVPLTHVTELTFSQGPYQESAAYRRFMGYDMPWYSARESADALLAGRWFGMLVSYLRDGDRVFETYWTTGRGTEVMAPAYGILDRTIYGRQEPFEDSPDGWPQHWVNNGSQFRTNGRPSAQWPRLAAGRSDDLTANPTP